MDRISSAGSPMIVKPALGFVLTVAGTTVIEAARNRLAWLAAIVIAASLGLAQFLNQVAIAESLQIELALLAALLRFAAVFIVATFVITSMVREANDKVTELLLSQPVPRSAYFFAKLAGYGAVAAALALAFSLPLALYAPARPVLLWGGSLVCELLIVTCVSLFCVVTLSQVLSAFAAAAGFYLLSRSIAAMQIIASASAATEHSFADAAVASVVNAIALVLPGIDRMTRTDWLLGAAPGTGEVMELLGQSALYVVLISSATLFDLHRRNF